MRDGETGYLVPPNDPDALAARLAEVIGNPALRDEFSRNAIAHVNARYTWGGVSRAVADLYEEVLDVRRRGVAADAMRAARQVAAGAAAHAGFPSPTY